MTPADRASPGSLVVVPGPAWWTPTAGRERVVVIGPDSELPGWWIVRSEGGSTFATHRTYLEPVMDEPGDDPALDVETPSGKTPREERA